MIRTALIALGLSGMLLSAPAFADRGPNQQEAAAIAAKLTAAGFKSWNKVEFDPDGPKWKVDDARAIDGKTYDVHLDAKTYDVIKKNGD